MALSFFDVSNNNFESTIPSSIFNVPTLQVAYFSNNTFSGPIPPNYATPLDLRDLYLDGNGLTGEIPTIPDGSFTNLTELLFQNNELSGEMPESVCRLRDNTTTVPVLLEDLWSDCSGDTPQVVCDFPACCNRCFS